ncbi:hypothetical protein HDU67_006762 [Dinochytrium kinnereticum]|nr:hypothetical protein HDU67_006762 [Dinochytrium kinnereticum]
MIRAKKSLSKKLLEVAETDQSAPGSGTPERSMGITMGRGPKLTSASARRSGGPLAAPLVAPRERSEPGSPQGPTFPPLDRLEEFTAIKRARADNKDVRPAVSGEGRGGGSGATAAFTKQPCPDPSQGVPWKIPRAAGYGGEGRRATL